MFVPRQRATISDLHASQQTLRLCKHEAILRDVILITALSGSRASCLELLAFLSGMKEGDISLGLDVSIPKSLDAICLLIGASRELEDLLRAVVTALWNSSTEFKGKSSSYIGLRVFERVVTSDLSILRTITLQVANDFMSLYQQVSDWNADASRSVLLRAA